MLTRSAYAKILGEYDLARFPRNVGPMQRLVLNIDQLLSFVGMENGHSACYTSHNSWAGIDEFGHPSKVNFTKTFLDLDIDREPDPIRAKRDVDRLVEWSIGEDLPNAVTFSGHGGFQFFLHFKPSIHTIDQTLTNKIRGVQAWLKEQLGLTSLNLQCAEPKRLCRVPLSRYATTKFDYPVVLSSYCTPIPSIFLPALSLDDVRMMSLRPPLWDDYRYRGRKHRNLDQFVREYGVSIDPTVPDPGRIQMASYIALNMDGFGEVVKLLEPDPCVHNDLLTSLNPKHISRFSFAARLRQLGFGEQEAKDFFDQLENGYGWADRANKRVRDYYIRHIYRRTPPYSPAGCPRLMSEGLCIGEPCPKFKMYRRNDVGE